MGVDVGGITFEAAAVGLGAVGVALSTTGFAWATTGDAFTGSVLGTAGVATEWGGLPATEIVFATVAGVEAAIWAGTSLSLTTLTVAGEGAALVCTAGAAGFGSAFDVTAEGLVTGGTVRGTT